MGITVHETIVVDGTRTRLWFCLLTRYYGNASTEVFSKGKKVSSGVLNVGFLRKLNPLLPDESYTFKIEVPSDRGTICALPKLNQYVTEKIDCENYSLCDQIRKAILRRAWLGPREALVVSRFPDFTTWQQVVSAMFSILSEKKIRKKITRFLLEKDEKCIYFVLCDEYPMKLEKDQIEDTTLPAFNIQTGFHKVLEHYPSRWDRLFQDWVASKECQRPLFPPYVKPSKKKKK